jgi:hypothetical protein
MLKDFDMPHLLTAEQQLQADHFAALFLQVAKREALKFGELLASRADDQLLGKTEFDLRDLVLEERKKGGTSAPASSVPAASQTPT